MQLNKQQQQAVKTNAPAILNLSPAGTGKTTVLTQRTVRLLKEKKCSPSNLLLLTFTTKAAREMRERIESLLDSRTAYRMTIGTFHAICLHILRKWGQSLGYDTNHLIVYDEQDTRDILRIIQAELELKIKIGQYLHLRNHNHQFTEQDGDYYTAHQKYIATLKQENAVDFQQILIATKELLECDPQCQQYYHNKYQHILVDEFQDTDRLQWEIVELIQPYNIFAVGDYNQAIYSFRGADITVVDDFAEQYEPEIIPNIQNYRSTHPIVQSANTLIQHNQSPYNVEMQAQRDGESIQTQFFATIQEELHHILTHIPQRL